MKPNLVIAIVTGLVMGVFIGRATKQAPPSTAGANGPFAVAGRQVQAAANPGAPAPTPARRPAEADTTVYKVPVDNSPVAGKATAKVTLVEATDFECPFCSRANNTVHELQKTYGDALRVVIKQNPLSFHPNAMNAAQAALAAGEQG
ncbi:MAG: thioredoxin domain-containing protein, partial [Myxococcales bacterium]